MVALGEQFHHNGTTALPRRLQVTGYGLQGTGAGRVFRSWELGVRRLWKRCAAKCEMPDAGYSLQRDGETADVCNLHGLRTMDRKFGSPDGLFIDHCSLSFERSAGANEIIYCGFPDNKRVSTDIGTGLNDPEAELYYVRNRTYSSVPGTVLRQEPKSRLATGVATRVLQRDPIGYAGGINLYEYVSGRVVIALDAKGTTSGNQHQCCQKRQGNCCGADITGQLITMARQIQMVWNALPHLFKKVLARWTVIPPFAINAWGIHGMAIGGAPPTQAGTGKCVGTVTVAGNCYQEGTVNYWLAGLIYRALDSSWEFAPYAKLFEYEVAVYPIIPGLATGSPIVQKWYWWAAGTVGNPTAVPPPRKFRECVPNAVRNKLPLSWYWGFLQGQS